MILELYYYLSWWAKLRLGEFVFEMDGVKEDKEALVCDSGELIGEGGE